MKRKEHFFFALRFVLFIRSFSKQWCLLIYKHLIKDQFEYQFIYGVLYSYIHQHHVQNIRGYIIQKYFLFINASIKLQNEELNLFRFYDL